MATTISIDKTTVLAEIEKTTAYTGARYAGDETAYDRIHASEETHEQFSRYWDEAIGTIVDILKPFIAGAPGGDWSVSIEYPSSRDTNLIGSIEQSAEAYVVSYMLGKWYAITNKSESDKYLTEATGFIRDIRSKLYYKKKPTRVETSTGNN